MPGPPNPRLELQIDAWGTKFKAGAGSGLANSSPSGASLFMFQGLGGAPNPCLDLQIQGWSFKLMPGAQNPKARAGSGLAGSRPSGASLFMFQGSGLSI